MLREQIVSKIFSARFFMAVLTTTIVSSLVVWVMFKLQPEGVEKVAIMIVTGFISTWSSIVTFYFTRSDRKSENPK